MVKSTWCTCAYSCADDPVPGRQDCTLSPDPHTHPFDGSAQSGPCSLHPEAPMATS